MKRLLPVFLCLVTCGNKADDRMHARFVVSSETFRSNLDGKPAVKVIAAKYGKLERATASNPWDLFDPVSKMYVAAFSLDGKIELWAVKGPTDSPTKVSFEVEPGAEILGEAPVHGVLSADGKFLYLSTTNGAFVAARAGKALTFGAFKPVGHGVKLVHDTSLDGKLAIASGHKPIKWDNPSDVVAPRQMSIFEIGADGTLGADKSDKHPPLKDFMQSPVFMPDSQGLLFEGDDDLDTGDHLFLYRFGKAVEEIVPAKAKDNDFNTPCMTRDGRVLFWESLPKQYLLRIYDPKKKTTATVHDKWLPPTGYVRCR